MNLRKGARILGRAVTALADVLAENSSPFRSPITTEWRRAVCADPDHDGVETRCPACGQGPPPER